MVFNLKKLLNNNVYSFNLRAFKNSIKKIAAISVDEAYSNLGLIRGKTSKEELKTKWKELMKKYHPDINNSPDATETSQLINESANMVESDLNRGSGFNNQQNQNENNQNVNYNEKDINEDFDFSNEAFKSVFPDWDEFLKETEYDDNILDIDNAYDMENAYVAWSMKHKNEESANDVDSIIGRPEARLPDPNLIAKENALEIMKNLEYSDKINILDSLVGYMRERQEYSEKAIMDTMNGLWKEAIGIIVLEHKDNNLNFLRALFPDEIFKKNNENTIKTFYYAKYGENGYKEYNDKIKAKTVEILEKEMSKIIVNKNGVTNIDKEYKSEEMPSNKIFDEKVKKYAKNIAPYSAAMDIIENGLSDIVYERRMISNGTQDFSSQLINLARESMGDTSLMEETEKSIIKELYQSSEPDMDSDGTYYSPFYYTRSICGVGYLLDYFLKENERETFYSNFLEGRYNIENKMKKEDIIKIKKFISSIYTDYENNLK